MSIESVKAHIRCDGCNETFVVDLDRAEKLSETLDDYVWDVVANGNDSILGEHSVKGDHILCKKCTEYIEVSFDDKVQPTYDQVSKALNERAGV